jgi:hypothetical protein
LAVDTGPDRSYDSSMPMWRCPHCGTPQAEAARCWVCHRSSTACGSCRHFRRSVAAQLGYCGLDRRRLPLRGDEIRACWEGGAAGLADAPGESIRSTIGPTGAGDDRTTVRRLEFVPVIPVPRLAVDPARPKRTRSRSGPADPEADPSGSPPPDRSGAGATDVRWSLWGEPEA